MNQQIPPTFHLFLIHHANHAYLQQHIQPENRITFNILMPIFLELDQQISDFPKPRPPCAPTLNQENHGKPLFCAFRVEVEAFQARPAVKWLHTIISYHYPFSLRPSNCFFLLNHMLTLSTSCTSAYCVQFQISEKMRGNSIRICGKSCGSTVVSP